MDGLGIFMLGWDHGSASLSTELSLGGVGGTTHHVHRNEGQGVRDLLLYILGCLYYRILISVFILYCMYCHN